MQLVLQIWSLQKEAQIPQTQVSKGQLNLKFEPLRLKQLFLSQISVEYRFLKFVLVDISKRKTCM